MIFCIKFCFNSKRIFIRRIRSADFNHLTIQKTSNDFNVVEAIFLKFLIEPVYRPLYPLCIN